MRVSKFIWVTIPFSMLCVKCIVCYLAPSCLSMRGQLLHCFSEAVKAQITVQKTQTQSTAQK